MKTIEEAAENYIQSKYKEFALLDIIGEETSIKDLRDDFKAGVEFAQQMIDSNINLPDENVPVLVESIIYDKKFHTVAYIFVCENGLKMWYDFHQYFKTKDTKWRPINLK